MRALITQRTLLSLVLGLLFSSMMAMGRCREDYHALLSQLQKQANSTQDPSTLLDPYIRIQGLDFPRLRDHCKERPGAFPSNDALRGLGQQAFLRTLDATLSLVLHRLAALQRHLPEAQDLEKLPMARQNAQDLQTLKMARLNIQGLRNNIYCMSRLLGSSQDAAEPTQTGPGTSLPPTPTPGAFQRKLEGCRFLDGYHRFMRSVGQVFSDWGASPSQSRRHRPRRALQKGARRTRPSSRGKKLTPRGQLLQ
ncbi:oncostatin-M [Nycticebus coucang]|uniref:oncostatin-M n=1 Tax=Nycticebus coucang TaxID=9470 RepID=UPI00234D9EAA|nr:oncostatin-M [Nycticebus coucang]